MQVIKTVALQAANNTGQRIREQAAWFYLRHMNIDKDTSPSTAFHALLTRKERESLPAPQGRKGKSGTEPALYSFSLVRSTAL